MWDMKESLATGVDVFVLDQADLLVYTDAQGPGYPFLPTCCNLTCESPLFTQNGYCYANPPRGVRHPIEDQVCRYVQLVATLTAVFSVLTAAEVTVSTLGGRVLSTSDDFFASKDNLIKPYVSQISWNG